MEHCLSITRSEGRIDEVKLDGNVVELTDDIKGKCARIDELSEKGIKILIEELLKIRDKK